MPITPSKLISISTPLGKDHVVLTSFSGIEAISELYEFRVGLISEKLSIDPDKLLGKPVAIKLATETDKHRYFHGKVSALRSGHLFDWAEGSARNYEVSIVPWLWFLNLTSNYRVFQDKTIPQIVEQVFKDSGMTDYQLKISGPASNSKLDLCLQYGETDLQFVSRLMERAGIVYYFVHEETKHNACLLDKATAYGKSAPNEVEFDSSSDSSSSVTKWQRQQQVFTGKYENRDYDFTKVETVFAKEKTVVKLAAAKTHEVFRYAGGFSKAPDAKADARIGIETAEAQYDFGAGSSACGGFSAGLKFKFSKHPDKTEVGQEYVLTHVEHSSDTAISMPGAGQSDQYVNSFKCIPGKIVARPLRTTPIPKANSVERATVVGAKGEEIYTDKYGRIRIQFHWDRTGKFDEKSTAWVRVAQGWSGNKWGMQFLPRIGQEVMVNFLNGDPDRPVVTAGLPNEKHYPPYTLPDNKNQSGIKTQSTTKGKATDFHELRFDDTKEKEHVYFHSQRDFARVVENIDTLEIGYDKSAYAKEDSRLKIAGDKGDQLINILNNRTTIIDKGLDKLQLKCGDRDVLIDKGNDSLTVAKGDRTIKIKMGKHKTEAQKEIFLKVGQSSIKIDQQGITIKSAKVDIQGQMKVSIKAGLQLDAEGTMTTVKGSGMLTLKGGLVKIN